MSDNQEKKAFPLSSTDLATDSVIGNNMAASLMSPTKTAVPDVQPNVIIKSIFKANTAVETNYIF